MLIIVEGPDCGGKSSLVRKLEAALKRDRQEVQVLHRGPPMQHPLDEYERPLWSYRPGNPDQPHIICDRWHLGELVYPRVKHRITQLDLPILRHIELTLAARGAVVVHVTAHDDELKRRLRERGDDYVRQDEISSIRAGFDWAVKTKTTLPVIKLFGDYPDTAVNLILAEGDKLECETAPLAPFVTYVGDPEPRLLLVGDVRGPGNDDPQAPAFVPYLPTSGHYLLNALGEAMITLDQDKVRWRTLGLANANDADDIDVLWKTLGKPRVIALGGPAQVRLRRTDVPFETAPHPQWVRRFKHSQAVTYGAYLLGLTEDLRWL